MCGATEGGLSLVGIDTAKEAIIQGKVTRAGDPVGGVHPPGLTGPAPVPVGVGELQEVDVPRVHRLVGAVPVQGDQADVDHGDQRQRQAAGTRPGGGAGRAWRCPGAAT